MLLPLREAWLVYSGFIRSNEDVLQCCYANCFKLNLTALSLNIKDGVMRRGETQSPQKQTKTPFHYFATIFTYLWFTESHCQ
jgi:hypothetical protein